MYLQFWEKLNMANSISVRVKERVLLAASKARGLSAATDTSGRRISMAEFGVRGSWRILQTTGGLSSRVKMAAAAAPAHPSRIARAI